MQIKWLKLIDIVKETSEVSSFYLERPTSLTWEAGAFTHIGLPGFNEGDRPNKSLVRHMSINHLADQD